MLSRLHGRSPNFSSRHFTSSQGLDKDRSRRDVGWSCGSISGAESQWGSKYGSKVVLNFHLLTRQMMVFGRCSVKLYNITSSPKVIFLLCYFDMISLANLIWSDFLTSLIWSDFFANSGLKWLSYFENFKWFLWLIWFEVIYFAEEEKMWFCRSDFFANLFWSDFFR